MLLVQVLQSCLLAVGSCPSHCSCSDGAKGKLELRLGKACVDICFSFAFNMVVIGIILLQHLIHVKAIVFKVKFNCHECPSMHFSAQAELFLEIVVVPLS